jgi:hypothetical protein
MSILVMIMEFTTSPEPTRLQFLHLPCPPLLLPLGHWTIGSHGKLALSP